MPRALLGASRGAGAPRRPGSAAELSNAAPSGGMVGTCRFSTIAAVPSGRFRAQPWRPRAIGAWFGRLDRR